MSHLIWTQTVWYSEGIPEFFLKTSILKKSVDGKKNMQNYPECIQDGLCIFNKYHDLIVWHKGFYFCCMYLCLPDIATTQQQI